MRIGHFCFELFGSCELFKVIQSLIALNICLFKKEKYNRSLSNLCCTTLILFYVFFFLFYIIAKTSSTVSHSRITVLISPDLIIPADWPRFLPCRCTTVPMAIQLLRSHSYRSAKVICQNIPDMSSWSCWWLYLLHTWTLPAGSGICSKPVSSSSSRSPIVPLVKLSQTLKWMYWSLQPFRCCSFAFSASVCSENSHSDSRNVSLAIPPSSEDQVRMVCRNWESFSVPYLGYNQWSRYRRCSRSKFNSWVVSECTNIPRARNWSFICSSHWFRPICVIPRMHYRHQRFPQME